MIFKTVDLDDFPKDAPNRIMVEPHQGRPCVYLNGQDTHMVFLDFPGFKLCDEPRAWLRDNTDAVRFHCTDWTHLVIVFKSEADQFAFKMRWERAK